MKRALREQVRNKYGGLCAYTGKPLDDIWQVDHMIPLAYFGWRDGDPNHIDNLVPALRIVNHYKRALTVDGFRRYPLTLHDRLKRLPKNPKVDKSVNRKRYLFEVADLFGITPDKPFSGNFYFETIV